MIHKNISIKHFLSNAVLLIIGGILLLSCGCNKTQQFERKQFECLNKEGPFLFTAVCADTVYKGKELEIFCELKNTTSQSYEIRQEVFLINYMIDGVGEPYITLAKKATIEGNSVSSRVIKVTMKEAGEHIITIFSKFDVLDEVNKDRKEHNYEIRIPIIVK